MDYGAWSAASTISDCQNVCYNNASCTAVDWVPAAQVGQQCWLHFIWSGGTRKRQTGVEHYVISRTNCSKLVTCHFMCVVCILCIRLVVMESVVVVMVVVAVLVVTSGTLNCSLDHDAS